VRFQVTRGNLNGGNLKSLHRFVTAQYQSASGGHQSCWSYGIAS